MSDPTVCGGNVAPSGWYCTRLVGHAGPCAAVPLDDEDSQILRELRQLEWDKTEGDTPFASANNVVDRHNREIVSAYKMGVYAAKHQLIEYMKRWPYGK